MARRKGIETRAAGLRRSAEDWENHAAQLRQEAERGEMGESRLAASLADTDENLQRLDDERQRLASRKDLVTVAFDCIVQAPSLGVCPVCGSKVDDSALRDRLKQQLEEGISQEFERIAAEETQVRASKRKIAARQK